VRWHVRWRRLPARSDIAPADVGRRVPGGNQSGVHSESANRCPCLGTFFVPIFGPALSWAHRRGPENEAAKRPRSRLS
jgi:hypothetical protein